MANAQSFPLLRLPNLAREHIIMIMDVREQYLFSKLSKKSERIVKTGTRLISYVCDLVLYWGSANVSIRKDWCRQELEIKIVRSESENHYCADRSKVIFLELEDIKEKSIEILVFLKNTFKISSFKLKTYQISKDIGKDFLETAKNLRIDIDELEVKIENDGNQNEMFQWVMESFRNVKKLRIECRTTLDFEFDSQRPFTFDCCYIRCAPWLTLGLIKRFFWGCRHFYAAFIANGMSNQDLNQVVKSWIEGDSKLEYLELGVSDWDIQEVLTDIEKVPVKSVYVGNFLRHYKPGCAFKIEAKNGIKAVVCRTFGTNLVITTQFDKNPRDLYTE